MLKKGDQVVQIVPAPIKGVVTGFAMCQETGEVHVKVGYTDDAGNQHERHFKQSEVSTPAE
jgi:hypothetical protein